MSKNNSIQPKHFTLSSLADGIYACIHKAGGGAYSNAGIIDLGERTLIVDAFDTMAAGRELRRTAEDLFERPVDTIVLTHPHSDHWIGASAFDTRTTLIASIRTHQVCLEWGAEIIEGYQNPSEWEAWLTGMEEQLKTEQDQRVRVGLEKSITRARYTMSEMAEFQPRYADQTFEDRLAFQGSKRTAELRSYGGGHSEDDAVLLLPEDGIAFIGDIGFFDSQPFLGYCDIDLYRKQLLRFRDSDFRVLVPGHGPLGNQEDIDLQLEYMNVMEEQVGEVAKRGGSFEEAMQITLPEPFDQWLMGGMARFEANVRYLFARCGGEVPEDE